jgi:hypothetical protein
VSLLAAHGYRRVNAWRQDDFFRLQEEQDRIPRARTDPMTPTAGSALVDQTLIDP